MSAQYKTVKEAWESYLKQVVPKDAHETQIIETQKAFFAGCGSALHMVTETVCTPGITEDQFITKFEAWRREGSELARSLLRREFEMTIAKAKAAASGTRDAT